MLRPYFNLVKEAQNLGIDNMFGGAASGYNQGQNDKNTAYAQEIVDLKNSNPALSWQQAFDQVVQQHGIAGMEAMKNNIIAKVKELAGQPQAQPAVPEEIANQPTAIPANQNPYQA